MRLNKAKNSKLINGIRQLRKPILRQIRIARELELKATNQETKKTAQDYARELAKDAKLLRTVTLSPSKLRQIIKRRINRK